MLRRKFLKLSATIPLLASGLHLFLTACGSGSSGYGAGGGTTPAVAGNCSANGTTNSVGSNHGHSAPVVPAGDVVTGAQQTYAVPAGSAGHSHNVTVTAASFTALLGNTGVAITTDADGTGHSHVITINCA